MMIDAEQTYLQAALGYLVLILQSVYNKDEIIVYNTYQCFRKDTLDRIKADCKLAEELGFKNCGIYIYYKDKFQILKFSS